jgi:hypothetical protein
VSFAAITLCVPSQRVAAVYFVIDSVRKLLVRYTLVCMPISSREHVRLTIRLDSPITRSTVYMSCAVLGGLH